MRRHLSTWGLVLAVLAAALGAGGLWFSRAYLVGTGGSSEDAEASLLQFPAPPVPPRIAEDEDYDRCLGMLSSDPEGAKAFAEAWEATGGGSSAEHCGALAEIALGNAETGAEMLEHLAATAEAPEATRGMIYDQAAQAWMMANSPTRAYGASTMALALAPDNPDLLIDRAVAAASLERFREAITDLDRALEIEPRREDALVYRASSWRHLGEWVRAEEDIDEALSLDPDNANALLERGILRQRRGDLAGARADWQRAIELAPNTSTSDLAEQNLALLEMGPERR
ncbi:MAG: tetratricopeptide repeat protein [Acidobacteriia bacterium]|nr:tetratricopeptide repeat protein [Methyloceanibacter sp.]MBX5472402.1 tetratricopeptide repeat protein [Acetobacteraceae bacterium]MCL6492545.1 tetratricopeptide repeat protein [Terriglobia bacterium]